MKMLVVFVMVTLVLGCSTTLHNMKSAKELKENKLLRNCLIINWTIMF
jgi:hypothetical protein